MTVASLLAEASTSISRRDGEVLLAHMMQRERSWLLAHPEAEIDPAHAAEFRALAARRAEGEPLQYVTGTQEFYGVSLRVTPAVLIPRPETEHLVEQVLLWATQFHDGRVLEIADVGTGSGAIAIALATHLAGVYLTAIDSSEDALVIAQENAVVHKCEDRITFLHGDLLHPAGDDVLFDAIVSNPPYVPTTDAATMQREVVAHEPHAALFAGPDGLDVYRRLIPQAHAALREGGLLALEIGFGQRSALTHLLADWHHVRFVDDYTNIPRVALATRL